VVLLIDDLETNETSLEVAKGLFLTHIQRTQTSTQARIVFTSSLAGRITQPKEGIYASSKAALESLGDALRQELFPYQVSVSLVEPGFVATPILTKVSTSSGSYAGIGDGNGNIYQSFL